MPELITEQLKEVSTKLIEHKYEIAKCVTDSQKDELTQITDEFLSDLVQIRADIIQVLAESILINKAENNKKIEILCTEVANRALHSNIPMDEIIKSISLYRTELWDAVEVIAVDDRLSKKMLQQASTKIHSVLDHAVFTLSTAFVEHHQTVFKSAQESFLELSAPVVPLSDDVAVLPLIGDIDTNRVQVILDQVLTKSVQYNLSVLFIDLSGVPIVDTMVAQKIYSIVSSLTLLGVDTILTGIRPEIAQTMVHLGVDFPDIKNVSTLKKAIANHPIKL